MSENSTAWYLRSRGFPILFSALTLGVVGAAKVPPEATIVLTSKENGLQNQTEFLCSGKIYGYIRLPQRQYGTHILESRWISPAQKIAAESRTTVDFRPARSTAQVWFSFPERNALRALPDPSLDQELITYPGVWHLEVHWDDQPLLKSSFTVRCP